MAKYFAPVRLIDVKELSLFRANGNLIAEWLLDMRYRHRRLIK